jgi:hypothetical protein
MAEEKKYYGSVIVKTLDLISPTESELMKYYSQYGFKNMNEVINDYGINDMLREWYNNTAYLRFETVKKIPNIQKSDYYDFDAEVEVLMVDEFNEMVERDQFI